MFAKLITLDQAGKDFEVQAAFFKEAKIDPPIPYQNFGNYCTWLKGQGYRIY